MQENTSLPITEDRFMKTFKYFKSNKPKPSLKDVITAEKCSDHQVINITANTVIEDPRAELLGLKNLREWQVFTLKKHPGLLFIRNPFTALGQRYWIRKCLEEYPKKPNKLNIDIEITLEDWWRECFRNGECEKQLQKKLRWTTLGYHHNWDTKVYTESNKSKFPEDLAELSDVLAKYLGYSDFTAEAAIVNYYHMNSTLSAHTDHSEVNLKAPLFSFSFGQSAIFLIGGRDKSVEPSALLINSGDIVVMSKEARLCYHAVPKILPAVDSPWDVLDTEIIMPDSKNINFKYISQSEDIMLSMKENIDNKWHRFKDYIKESRINMNVRQVLNENQTSILMQ
ncbi:nucleic acid dioxygenase ALKBH1 [Helicoverpa armigera]|uniref:nucleic acid dioxygenase ALKBH1 n=1 Tax=Helicoverpa armigera TaxID=29058 RepID=UPI0030829B77